MVLNRSELLDPLMETTMLNRSFVVSAVALLAFGVLPSLIPAASAAEKDIVATAVEAGSFQTLAAALKAAGLVETLQGKGPFTVFAPTDEAFARLPAGTVESLLKPENKRQLVAVLTYHVVGGKVPAAHVVKLKNAVTVNGQRVDIKSADGKVQVDQATVVKADIHCSNGVIHVIDRVIQPSSDTIPVVADRAKVFKTLLAAANAAGLLDVLSGDQPLTLFAPTDEAFAKLPAGTVENLLKPENKDKLAAILKFHVVPGRVFSNDVLSRKEFRSLQGGHLTAAINGSTATISGAKLLSTDIDATNGVIHVIDSVLLPPTSTPKAQLHTPVQSRMVAHVCPNTRRVMYYTVQVQCQN